ncbi:MAG: hypothetical protein AB1801_20865 [Chloroflexota bacterium]
MASKPLQLEIVAHVLGGMNHCSHCQVFIDGVGVGGQVKQADLDAYPPEFMADWQRLSNWILALAQRHAGQLVIKVIDAQSPQGLWKALRHGVRQYPTFIIEGKQYRGWETEADFSARLHQLLVERERSISMETAG